MPTDDTVNILIVDDSPSNLVAMAAILADLEQNVVTVQSGREALRQLQSREFAVILLDVNMPEMDGLETAMLIRQRKGLAHIPIIFVTAFADDAHTAHVYSLGAVDYLLTPVVPEVLRTKVGVFVELARQNAQIRHQATQRIALADEQAARRAAETANRVKDQFLATLSHELRTPLNAIVGWTYLLKVDPQTPEALLEGLDVIERNAKFQARIIDDLLDVSRIMSGKLQLELQPADLNEIIEAALVAIQPAAHSKQIVMEFVPTPDLPPTMADAARVQQVIFNLVTNAIKFTPPEGRVSINTRFADGRLEVHVTDTGQGIRADFLPCVFDPFRQADSTSTRQHGGLGLGLSIVRQLVEMHGGSVAVASPGEGRGSTFTVRFPQTKLPTVTRVPSDRSAGEFSNQLSPPSLDGIQVLGVDDERSAREVLKRILAQHDADAVVVESAQVAFDLLKERRFDALVTDIGMPDFDGYDLIRKVRSKLSADELPAIALTAYAAPSEQMKILAAGFQRHLSKPIDPNKLIAAIAELSPRNNRILAKSSGPP